MFIKTLFQNINQTVQSQKNVITKFQECAKKRKKILPLEDECEMPNLELEKQIGISICGVEYNPEDWLGYPMGPDFTDNKLKTCEKFNLKGPICTDKDCPVYAAHCEYFNAKNAHNTAVVAHNNAIRRVFDLREK